MKSILTCAALVCVSLFVRAEEPRKDSPTAAMNKSLDGTWTVLSAEKNGQSLGEAKDLTVTVKDNVVTCRDKAGKEMKLKMELTGAGQARVTEEGATTTRTSEKPAGERPEGTGEKATGAKAAVYVLTNDFLAICVHEDKATTGDVKPASATEPARTDKGAAGKTYCSFVLKRADGSGERK